MSWLSTFWSDMVLKKGNFIVYVCVQIRNNQVIWFFKSQVGYFRSFCITQICLHIPTVQIWFPAILGLFKAKISVEKEKKKIRRWTRKNWRVSWCWFRNGNLQTVLNHERNVRMSVCVPKRSTLKTKLLFYLVGCFYQMSWYFLDKLL